MSCINPVSVKTYCSKIADKLITDIKRLFLPIIIVLVYLVVTYLIFGYNCPYRLLFGRLCPGCGLTHSCISILCLDFKTAYEYNIAGFAWVILIIYAIISRYFTDRKPRFLMPVCIITCLITFMQWAILGRFVMTELIIK